MFGRDSKTKPFVTEPFVTGILVDGVGPTNSRHPKHLRWLPEVQPVMSTTLPGAEGRCFEVNRSPIPHNFRGKCVTKFKKKGILELPLGRLFCCTFCQKRWKATKDASFYLFWGMNLGWSSVGFRYFKLPHQITQLKGGTFGILCNLKPLPLSFLLHELLLELEFSKSFWENSFSNYCWKGIRLRHDGCVEDNFGPVCYKSEFHCFSRNPPTPPLG